MEIVVSVLMVMSTSVPLYLLWLVGIVLALVRMREQPHHYRLVAISLAILLVVSVFGIGFSVIMPFMMREDARTFEEITNALVVVNIIGQIVNCIAWVLLLVALFARNTTTVHTEIRHPDGGAGF